MPKKPLIFIFFYYPLLVKPLPALKTTMEIFGIFWQIEANSLRHQRSPLSFLLLFPTVQTQKKKKKGRRTIQWVRSLSSGYFVHSIRGWGGRWWFDYGYTVLCILSMNVVLSNVFQTTYLNLMFWSFLICIVDGCVMMHLMFLCDVIMDRL